MDQVAHKELRFGPFALDLARGSLRKGEREIELRPKAFEVLRHLAENAGRLVSKDELFDAVWPNVTVSDDSLVQCIRELREKLGDTDHRLIKTVPRRGYLLEAPPPAEGPPTPAGATISVAAREASARPSQRTAPIALAAASILAALAAVAWFGPWARPQPAREANSTQRINAFKDCAECPEMVALSAGQFLMGAPSDERGRQRNEPLPRTVSIKTPFAIGRFEVTVGQFVDFLAETGLAVDNKCHLIEKIDGDAVGFSAPKASFRNVSYALNNNQPVGCASLHDAQAYVAWLRRRTGKPYRLPTEAEWEYAARAGSSAAYGFGDDDRELCNHARFADLDTPFGWRGTCRSGITTYGPIVVGSLKPNAWGLFDMHGNIWEWVEDCWTPNPDEMPTDGTALSKPGTCEIGVLRGGSWASGSLRVRSAYRLRQLTSRHDENMGFRVALSLGK